MRLFVPLAFALAACDEIPSDAEPCPEGTPLSDADLPCDCQGAVVEALTCGDLICESVGLAMGDTGACTSTSTTTSR